MTNQLPIQQHDRTIIVDVLRGFALFGVLNGNFCSMLTNNVPPAIIYVHASSFDLFLSRLHDIFIENKFITLFSILFGYGFGVIMQRLETKNINSTSFFLRRMFWLFIFGLINLTFWNGDILHIYAVAGIFLLLFRRSSDRDVLFSGIFFLLILPVLIRIYQQYGLKYSLESDTLTNNYYLAYKFGSLKAVAAVNYGSYLSQWVYTWVEWRDISETLGRFLLGYYILRKQTLIKLDENILLIRKIWKWALGLTLLYILLQILSEENMITMPRFLLRSLLKTGVLFMTVFYVTSIIRLYHKGKLHWLMQAFRNLGSMTLTNYLAETVMYVIIFYGLGFGLLGDFSFGIIWAAVFVVYFLQAVFSKWWLSKFYYGPMEWIWRQLTYRKRFKLSKSK